MSPTTGQQARAERIAAELASLGLALPGTLIERQVRCGKPGCRCHAEPPVLHGPYWQWTRKIGGKTVTRLVPGVPPTFRTADPLGSPPERTGSRGRKIPEIHS